MSPTQMSLSDHLHVKQYRKHSVTCLPSLAVINTSPTYRVLGLVRFGQRSGSIAQRKGMVRKKA